MVNAVKRSSKNSNKPDGIGFVSLPMVNKRKNSSLKSSLKKIKISKPYSKPTSVPQTSPVPIPQTSPVPIPQSSPASIPPPAPMPIPIPPHTLSTKTQASLEFKLLKNKAEEVGEEEMELTEDESKYYLHQCATLSCNSSIITITDTTIITSTNTTANTTTKSCNLL